MQNILVLIILKQVETLEIKFLHPDFFYDKVNKQMIEQDSVIKRQIPRQMKIDDSLGASQIFLSSAGPAQSTMSSMMYGNLAINIAMSASLQMLWGMINVMQIIVKMPLLNVTFPSNAATFYTFISDIASFDLLPMDKINSAIFHFTDEKQTDQNFNEMGYKSDNIFENLGSMVMYLLGFVVLVLFVLLIRYLKNRYVLQVFRGKGLTLTCRVDKVYQYLVKLLFWNMILRIIMEGYIDYAISSILNVQNVRKLVVLKYLFQMLWKTSSDRISSVFSIAMLIVVLVFPFFVWALLWIKFKNLPEEETIQKYGSTYNSIRNDSRVALLYNVFYMLRRLFLALVVSFLKQVSFLQVQLIIFHCVFMIVYLQAVKPFDMPILNRMEIFNECCIMIAAYHLFTFTDFVGDPDVQYQMGWSIIGITLINVAINMAVMFYGSFQNFKLLFRKLRYKYLQWKLSKRNKAKTEPMMNQTQIPMIKNNDINQLQVEDINAEYDGVQEVSASTVSQNNNQGGGGKDIETEQTNEIDLSKHVMFTMRKQANQQFVKKVTSLDDLKRQYERKMTADEFKKSNGVVEELQYKIAQNYQRRLLPEDPTQLSKILNGEGEDGMKRDVPKLAIKMNHINTRQTRRMLDTYSIDDDVETGTNKVVGNIMQESAAGTKEESKPTRQTTEYKNHANHSQKMANLLMKITSGLPN